MATFVKNHFIRDIKCHLDTGRVPDKMYDLRR